MRFPWLLAATGAWLGCASAWASGGEAPQPPPSPSPAPSATDVAPVFDALQQGIHNIFQKCRSAVVRIEAADHFGYLSGSGFFVDPNGTLFTSYTVGGETNNIEVMFDGKRFPARRLVSDIRSGIAILKIDSQTPFLAAGNSRQLGVASPVIAIGYPLDLPLTPIFGTIGGFDLKYQGRFFATTHIRANIAVQRGEGGAPLVNSRGEVVGVLISRVESGNASYVLPIEAAEKVRKDFMRFHEVRPGWIGVRIKPLDEPVDGSTAGIEEILPDAPGQKAGLQAGDVIVQVGDRRVACPEDVLDASFFLTAKDETLIRVARDGSERDFNVTPENPPTQTIEVNPEVAEPPVPAPVKGDREGREPR